MDKLDHHTEDSKEKKKHSFLFFFKRFRKKSELYSKRIGPGIVTGAADDDPSGIATYSQAGASHGFSFLWLSLYTFPLMAIIQEMCARIAIATRKGLATNIAEHFSRKALYFVTFLLFVSNTFNIGADLGAMAEALQLLFPQISSVLFLLLIALICISFEIFSSYSAVSKYLKWLTFVLVAYIVAGIFTSFDIKELLYATVVPNLHFNRDTFIIIAAVLGTTISPYLFFWQTSQEVEEKMIHAEDKVTKKEEVKAMRYDVWFGMFFSNLVMFFIIAVCADNLFNNGITDIATAAEAADALRPVAGDLSYLFFTLGIIGTGFLAIPVLAGSSAYAIAESFKWKEGLYRKFKEARPFYLVIIASVVLGLLQNFLGIPPFKALVYSALLNGIIAPFVLIFIVLLARDKQVMGHLKSSRFASGVGFVTILLMLVVAFLAVFELLM